jgi:hypothetical protein
MSCGLTHRGRARLEQQLGLSLPFLHGVEVHHRCVLYCDCGTVMLEICNRTRTGILSPQISEGMRSSCLDLGVWESRSRFLFDSRRTRSDRDCPTCTPASRDSLLHLAILISSALTE